MLNRSRNLGSLALGLLFWASYWAALRSARTMWDPNASGALGERVRSAVENGSIESRESALGLREDLMDAEGTLPERERVKAACALLAAGARFESTCWPILEAAATRVAGSFVDVKRAQVKDFTDAGLTIEPNWQGWNPPYRTADIDGDGRTDIIMAIPGARSPSHCFILQNARSGWKSIKLTSGTNIWNIGLIEFGNGIPPAVLTMSPQGSEYDPTFDIHVWKWQEGAMRLVLTDVLTKGSKWSVDRDSRGLPVIVFHEHDSPWDDKGTGKSLRRFAWTGRQFGSNNNGIVMNRTAERQQTPSAVTSTVGNWEAQLDNIEDRLFTGQKPDQVYEALEKLLSSMHGSRSITGSDTALSWEAVYCQAICLRKMGRNYDALERCASVARQRHSLRMAEVARLHVVRDFTN